MSNRAESLKRALMMATPFSERFRKDSPALTLAELRLASPSLKSMQQLTSRYVRRGRDDERVAIYFIQRQHVPLIKIGHAKDVVSRMAEHQRGSPDLLRLLWCYTAPAIHERELHRVFHEQREHGEWFRPDSVLTDYIAQRKPGLFRPSRSRKAAA